MLLLVVAPSGDYIYKN